MAPDIDTSLSIDQILGFLRRRAPAIVICLVVVAASSFLLSKHQTKTYTATASLLFSSAAISQQVAGLPAISSSQDQQSQQDTNVQLALLGDMAAKTATALGHGLTKAKVKADLSVAAVSDTNVVNVSAVSASPSLAAAIANTYSNTFVREQQTSNQQYYASALALVTRQLAALSPTQKLSSAGLSLQARAQSLGTLAELRSGTVQVAQAASTPTSPSSPKTFRNTVLAALLGLLIGVCVALVLERADRVIREPGDLAAIYNLPLLGAIPESAALSRSVARNTESGGVLPSVEAETFHLIRAHLRYFNVDRELRTLLVVSAASGDGKTTLACHLAGAAARMGSKVLLLEADVRRPTIAAKLQLDGGPGLSDVLIGAASMDEAVQTVALDAPSPNGSAHRMIDVLVAGAVGPPNPAELIESQAMKAVLDQAKADYDLVVVDTPPLTAVSDAFPLLLKVDGVIIIGRVGRDRRDVALRTHETLSGVGAPLLGVIANGVKAGGRGYTGYEYGYGNANGQDRTRPATRGEREVEPADSVRKSRV